jgi:two-component system, LytTR family, sensor kinase
MDSGAVGHDGEVQRRGQGFGADLAAFMAQPIETRRWLRAWAISSAAWTLATILLATSSYTGYRMKGVAFPWIHFLVEWIRFQIWAFFSPFIFWSVWRSPIRRPGVLRLVAWHVLAGVAVSAVLVVPWQMARQLMSLFVEDRIYMPTTTLWFAGILLNQLFAYLDVAAIAHAVHFARETRAGQLRASKLEAQLAQAQLQSLKAQIHPHFLFNTLNSVSSLIHRDIDAADRVIALLSDLLRQSLELPPDALVPLRRDLEFLGRYLEIEKTRYKDRLRLRVEVAPEVLDAEVPSLILQPIVENAIRHGIARRSRAGIVEIHGRQEGEALVLEVRDDGPGLPESGVFTGHGVGLANTEARLKQHYPNRYRFELLNHPEGGLVVRMSFPFTAASLTTAA